MKLAMEELSRKFPEYFVAEGAPTPHYERSHTIRNIHFIACVDWVSAHVIMNGFIFVTCMRCWVVLFRVIILFHSYICHNCIGSSNYRGNDVCNHWLDAVWLAADSTSIVPPTRVLMPILPWMVSVTTTTRASMHAHWHQHAYQWRPHISRTDIQLLDTSSWPISMSKPMPL